MSLYYADTSAVIKLRDARTIMQLHQYRRLEPQWTDWTNVTGVCRQVAVEMVR